MGSAVWQPLELGSPRVGERGRGQSFRLTQTAVYRAYDPDTARWLSRDPIGEAGGMNIYGYVGDNPVNWIDLLGLAAATIDCSGYKAYFGSTCCNGTKKVKDPYPEAAYQVCLGFASMYTGTKMQGAAACVAKCLIEVEGSAQKIKTCDSRNMIRLSAHVMCYASCGFVPNKGLPPGGADVGWNMLLPGTLRFWVTPNGR